ncbi:MAG: Phosphodiesterase, MJ0936 family [Candidatus Woesebacteria bacterium GW2011_GWA2_40_7b]|uniref:Phosphodiesterase, MJ0936 family n=1 Tax=Candidatus Woesebacteria bacterium GW2011_GWA2_40_7b TaxID=1618563 RepID=A0A0G0SY17_9BACT|nr:MAG: Phosphodiesterase, MJ0936 family [Candidatus Woesebacteria bacterium GW2011_GWA2_40_7b]
MKILVISDSHGNIANLKAVMEIGKKAGVKVVIHCGDWADLAAFDTVLPFGIPIYSVLGNADIDPDLEEALRLECKKFDPYLLKLKIDGRKIGVIHNVDFKNEKLYEFNIVFSGHLHSKEEKIVNWTKFVRPGALINGINFAVYETVSGTIEFVNE